MRNLYDQVLANMNSQALISLYSRPTLSWKLECESAPETQRGNVAGMVSVSDIESPTRITVAYVFIWIALGIECLLGCFSVCNTHTKNVFVNCKGLSICLTGCIVINLIWMLQTGASMVQQNLRTVENLDVLNQCADDITQVPVGDI